jgi:hypothetical protein
MEQEASFAVQRVLTLRASAGGGGPAAVGAAQAAEALVAEHFLLLRARAQAPPPGGPDAALERAASKAQALRFVELLVGGGLPPATAALAATGAAPAALAAAGAAPAPAAAAAPAPPTEDALAPLLRLRSSLAADRACLAASRETFSRDKGVLGAAAAAHGELARDAADSNELVRAWAEKQRRELRWVGAAAVLLIATAAYVALRRVAWLFGVRLW